GRRVHAGGGQDPVDGAPSRHHPLVGRRRRAARRRDRHARGSGRNAREAVGGARRRVLAAESRQPRDAASGSIRSHPGWAKASFVRSFVDPATVRSAAVIAAAVVVVATLGYLAGRRESVPEQPGSEPIDVAAPSDGTESGAGADDASHVEAIANDV